ncbi:MAG: hypothetical protein J0M11_06015 [Anaerolineae bacterium]|jgi:hypothetical protein|nr:hypothetical protein [Anaerolineae bacterium]
MFRRSYKIVSLTAVLILMLACVVPSLGSTPAPIPTFDPNGPLTAIALTAGSAATQTAINAPPTATATPLPTKTPLPTPTPTATFLFLIPTISLPPTQIPLGVSNKEFDCQVLAVDPSAPIAASTSFIGKWLVANIGTGSWRSDNVDYRYAEGDKFHLQSVYDFPVNVQPGSTVELTVDMQAPGTPGEYITRWRINQSNKVICTMEMKIIVQ